MSTEAENQAEYQRARAAWLARPRRPMSSPSRRTPHRSWHFNHADQIERQLQEEGHRAWGYVIYRTCYGNDEDWAEFLRRLRYWMERHFQSCNGMDILDLFTLTVFDDPEHLDGASTTTVRERFCEWRATAPQAEQPPRQHPEHLQQQGPEAPGGGRPSKTGESPRYRFAIQVDAASLHSILHEAPAPPDADFQNRGWVKLIDGSWGPATPESSDSESWEESWEPLEGDTDYYVGWMKIPYKSAMDEYYVNGWDRNFWPVTYRRPPAVVGWVPPPDTTEGATG